MHPLTELKRLLGAREGRQAGTILDIENGQARVATSSGIVTASLGQVTAVAGGRVMVEQGRVIGRLSAAAPREYRV